MARNISLLKDDPNSTVNILGNRPTQTPGQEIPGAMPGQAPEASQPPQAATQQSTPSSGSYQNLKAYMQANKPGASRMGQYATQQAQQKVDTGRKNIAGAEQQFRQAATSSAGQFATEESRAQQLAGVKSTAEQAARGAYQAPAAQPVPGAPEAVQSQPQAQQPAATTQQPAFTDEDFARAINVEYAGPKSLEEAGLYGKVRTNLQDLSTLGQQAQTQQGRQQYLRDILGKRGDYTSGESRLDSLLFGGQKENVENLQNVTKGIGSLQDEFSQVQGRTRGLAGQLASDIGSFRDQARGAFQETASGRQAEVDQRLSQVVDNWDQLPEHFRDIFRKGMKTGKFDLSEQESQILGVQSGEGLYNILKEMKPEEFIKSTKADKSKLVSKQEQQQLAKLQALAEMSKDYGVAGSGIDFRNIYGDEALAGTQTALDAMNPDDVRKILSGAEKDFRSYAKGADIVGKGKGTGRYNKGWFRGRETVRKKVTKEANLADVLKDAGYNFKNPVSKKTADMDYLKSLANVSKTRSDYDLSDPNSVTDILSGWAGEDNAGLNAIDSSGMLGKIGTVGGTLGISQQLSKDVGEGIQSGASGFEQALTGSKKSLVGDVLTDPAQIVGKAMQDVSREAGKFTQDLFGGGKSGAKKEAKSEATRKAYRNLEKKLQAAIKKSGFERRINVADTKTTKARDAALQSLLANMDKTNL